MTLGEDRGLAWQISVWDDMADVYLRDIDHRFRPIIDHLLRHADLRHGQRVLDLGTGTGSVALVCAPRVTPAGHVIGVDISPEMLALAGQRVANLSFADGRAEAIPADGSSQDAVSGFAQSDVVIDRAAAAREIARVLKPGGCLERLEPAKAAVRAEMWPEGDGPRRFRNETQFIIGMRGA